MRVLRAADHKRMVWKNGGGQTTEILVWPPGAGLDDFDWRISMANVERDGPFSAFAGIDRTLVILAGAGIRLDIAQSQPVQLTQSSQPHGFPADTPTAARLIDGAIVDLNVMTRRQRFSHTVRYLEGPTMVDANPGSTMVLVCVGKDAVLLESPDGEVRLDHLDVVVFDHASTSASIELPAQAQMWVIAIDPS